MRFFDKLFGKSSDDKAGNEITLHSTGSTPVPSVITKAIAERECNLSKAILIPFTEATLATGSLMQLAPTLKSIVAGNKIGNTGKAIRKFISSVPFLAQRPIDERLQNGGNWLLKSNEEKAAHAVAQFSTKEIIGSEGFVDSIRNVSLISNQATNVLFDGEAIYLTVA